VLGVIFATGAYLWEDVKGLVLSRPEYKVDLNEIEITPLPEWIRYDIKQDVLKEASLNLPLDLNENNLAKKIHDAFSIHPWVEKVNKVTPAYPSRVRVDLVYRKPVLMVQVPHKDKLGWLPVDAAGVQLLVNGFTEADTKRYPRLAGPMGTPTTPAGTVWNDITVTGAAKIGAALADFWAKSPLALIRWNNQPTPENPLDRHFEIETVKGKKLIWGSAPGAEAANETKVEEKIKLLTGLLAQPEGIDKVLESQKVDLRDPSTLPK
jgi:hypothetical protein